MANRQLIREILAKYNVELHIKHDDTTLEDVSSKLGSVFKQTAIVAPFTGVIRDVYARLGVKSTAEKIEDIPAPYEKVVAATALSINRNSLDLQQMLDVKQGAYFEVALAASVLSAEGRLEINLEESEGKIHVVAKSITPGQMYSWGRVTTILDNLFSGITDYLKTLSD